MFCTNTVTWVYKLERDFVWASGKPVAADVDFRDRKGTLRARIRTAGEITVPYRRPEAAAFFLRLMTETGFALRYLYFIAVRMFGGLFRAWTHAYGKKRPRP